MLEKYEWKKEEKNYYHPSSSPQITTIPAFKFFELSTFITGTNDFS